MKHVMIDLEIDPWFLATDVAWVAYAYLVSVLPRPPSARRETRPTRRSVFEGVR